MTKLETIAYYEAINAKNRLLIIESVDSIDFIKNKLKEYTDAQDLGTIHIEIFHKDKNITSYSLIKFSENIFDLWEQKDNKVNKSNIDEITDFIYKNMPIQLKSPYIKFVHSKNENGTYNIHSFEDPEYDEIIDPKNVSLHMMNEHILGQFVFEDGRMEYHCINNEDISIFDDIIEKIQDDNIRLFAQTLINIIPPYVFEIPAGISGITNSASDLVDRGLLRHIINACNVLLMLTSTNYTRIKFTQRERDMMLVATLFSDTLKHGWQEDYEKSHTPCYHHPKMMADVIKATTGILPINELNFIANCVESHMGQWNQTNEQNITPLPMPDTDYKHFVHLANHIASAKNIVFVNDNEIYTFERTKIKKVKSYTIIEPHDLTIVKNALDKPIDMTLAKQLGISRSKDDIIDVWKHILEDGQASDKHLKYVTLAKQMIFD